jgi:hypothetical protein
VSEVSTELSAELSADVSTELSAGESTPPASGFSAGTERPHANRKISTPELYRTSPGKPG